MLLLLGRGSEPFPWIFIVVIGLAIAFVIVAAIGAVKRRKELAAWAQQKGLQFDPADDSSFDERFNEFDCLKQGHSRYAYNVMTGTISTMPICAFDYHYVTGSGKNRQTHRFSAVIIKPIFLLGPLFIRHENFLDKITEFVGYDDIDFESTEFSRKFYVKSPDRKWAYDVITPATMEFLLASPQFTIQFDTKQIIAYRNNCFSVSDFEDALQLIMGIIERIPKDIRERS